MSKEQGYAITTCCDQCPWRKDVPVGRFPVSRFIRLQNTVQQDFGPLFACHKTVEGKEHACAGYLLVDGRNNFRVRMALIQGRINWERLKSPAPLYGSYREMALANGVPQRKLVV